MNRLSSQAISQVPATCLPLLGGQNCGEGGIMRVRLKPVMSSRLKGINLSTALGIPRYKLFITMPDDLIDTAVGAIQVAGQVSDFFVKANIASLSVIHYCFGLRPYKRTRQCNCSISSWIYSLSNEPSRKMLGNQLNHLLMTEIFEDVVSILLAVV